MTSERWHHDTQEGKALLFLSEKTKRDSIMNWTRDILFSTPKLENQFRKYINERHEYEIGGFFFCKYGAPNSMQYRTWRKYTGSTSPVLRIVDWLLVPNLAESKGNQFIFKDPNYLNEIVTLTARQKRMHVLNFHSHPKDTHTHPSADDIAFALQYCELWKGHYQFAIATSYPLRIQVHHLETDNPSKAAAYINLHSGKFWSWRSKVMRPLVSDLPIDTSKV